MNNSSQVSTLVLVAAIATSMLPTIAAAQTSAVLPDEAYYTIVPNTYCCKHTGDTITIDGRPNETAWEAAPWTSEFVDIEGEALPRPRFSTRVKMLWNANNFYFYAEMKEPHVWGTLTERDAVIFHDNDFEIFLSPTGDNHKYYEFEMNALNTVWDLFLPKPYRDGGPADNGWNIKGLQTAVHVRGTLNDPSNNDEGWSVEIAIPWSAFTRHGERKPLKIEGNTWRVNFSRVQWQHRVNGGRYEKIPDKKENNWVWSPQGVIDMHRPEKWGWVRFVKDATQCGDFVADKNYQADMILHRLYWLQKEFKTTHKRWAKSFEELGVDAQSMNIRGSIPQLRSTAKGFSITYSWRTKRDGVGRANVDEVVIDVLSINQESLLEKYSEHKVTDGHIQQ